MRWRMMNISQLLEMTSVSHKIDWRQEKQVHSRDTTIKRRSSDLPFRSHDIKNIENNTIRKEPQTQGIAPPSIYPGAISRSNPRCEPSQVLQSVQVGSFRSDQFIFLV